MIITEDTISYGYHTANLTSEPYSLQEGVRIDGRIIEMYEIVFNACYLSCLIQC